MVERSGSKNISNVETFLAGQRVEDRKTGDRGTVAYVGKVDGSDGVWLGIDWDDENRGRHNGSHGSIQYFKARASTSGSFVREGRMTGGVSVEEAVRAKYQMPPPDTAPVEQMLQHAFNARFVEFVGMEKISKKQSDLEQLLLVDLKDCQVAWPGDTDLSTLLPRVRELNLSGCLISSWSTVAGIVSQLPTLTMLNLSDNSLELFDDPCSLRSTFSTIKHLIINKMHGYSWTQLLTSAGMFPNIHTLQMAYNDLTELTPVGDGLLEKVESLDIGANPITEWSEVLHLSQLPRLRELNANNCKLTAVKFPAESEEEIASHSTKYFSSLESLFLANNPLDNWRSVCELAKLPKLKQLVLGFEVKPEDYFPEFTYAIIRPLKVLNRTPVSWAEKRDYDLFYLKKFSKDYYNAGGTEDPQQAQLTTEFKEKHPTYLHIVRELGAPYDDRKEAPKSQARLKDLKLELKVLTKDGREECLSVLPGVKISRLKMTIKRNLKLSVSTAKIHLSYTPANRTSDIVIPLDSDHRDLAYYSVAEGDTLNVTW